MEQTQFLEDFNFIENYQLFEDSDSGQRKHYLRGVFSRINKPNKNKRIYTEDVMKESINSIQESIKNRGFVGELDHPSSPKINVKGISHIITKLDIAPDGAVLGEAEALDTEPGQHLKKLMEAHVRLGVSTRGVGSLEPYNGPLGEGYYKVKKGYRMKAIDIVFDPSAESYPEYFKEDTDEGIILGSTYNFRKVWEDVFGG